MKVRVIFKCFKYSIYENYECLFASNQIHMQYYKRAVVRVVACLVVYVAAKILSACVVTMWRKYTLMYEYILVCMCIHVSFKKQWAFANILCNRICFSFYCQLSGAFALSFILVCKEQMKQMKCPHHSSFQPQLICLILQPLQ